MFENIGKKIKHVAMAVTWIGILGSIIMGIRFMLIDDENLQLIGLLVIILGSFISWLSSFVLYGFGEIIDKTTEITKLLSGSSTVTDITDNEDNKMSTENVKNGRCDMCNKCGEVTMARIGDSTVDYRLCAACISAYKATPK